MAEEPDSSGQTPAKSTPTLKELSNALDSVVNWHLLGVKLGLEDHELRTIDHDFRGDGSERCKHEMLSHWLRNAKHPTWKAVTDALCLMGEHKVALRIQTKYCTDTDTAQTQQSMRTKSASEMPSAVGSQVKSQAPSCMVDSLVLAKENLRKIKFKYASLLSLALSVLLRKNINMSIFRVFLAALYLPEGDSNDAREINPSRFIVEVLGTAHSLTEIFELLMMQGLLSYKNFYVLRSIINHYASDDTEMKEKLSEYEQALAGYVLVTKMQDYLDAELQQGEQSKPDPKLFDELSVKVKANVTEKTLKYVNELWDSLAYQVKLPVTALPFHRVAKGCVEITWLLPFHLARFATRQLQESTDYFRKENIIRMTIAGRCVYEELPPVQESARREETDAGRKEDPSYPDAGNLSPLQRIEQLTDDEPEGPEAIPEHEQYMKCGRVVRINYSLLYGHLDVDKLLPKLPEKDLIDEAQLKAAQSYQQRFAKNAVVIDALLKFDRPSHGLLKFCDTLETTPGQEHLGRKLLKDCKYASPMCVHSQSPDTAVHSDLSETSELFQQLQQKVMDLLDQLPNALPKLKQILASLVLPLDEGKVAPLVDPLAYENAETVQELFRLMAPYWNPLSTDLLSLLLEASGCNQAASKVAEFVEDRVSKGHLVLCIRQLPTLASVESDLDVADLETVHKAPLPELQSLHPAVFASLPKHKVTSTRTTVRISVEVNKPLLCIADYEQITTVLSAFFTVPKAALVYVGCSKALLVLCWLASRDLVAYIKSAAIGGLSGHRLLAENKVTGVAVGDQIYKCPTIKEVQLFEACAFGMVGQVHHLLTSGVNVDVNDFDGATPLSMACQNGHLPVVERLIAAKADVNPQKKIGATPLYIACQNGHLPVVERLIAAKADVNHQTKDGATPLYVASRNGHLPVVEHLITEKADVNHQTKDGVTPLYVASQNGHLPVVEHLIAEKADVNHQTKDGVTPLYVASQNGHLPVVEHLIAEKADVNHQTKDGVTPLYVASQNGHLPVVEHLIAEKADVNHQTKEGWSPLLVACYEGHLLVVERLIAAKADVNHQTKEGWTPLLVACHEGHLLVVEHLIAAKADINHQTKEGATPLCVACQEGHLPVVERLIAAKADVNYQMKEGWTPLLVACEEGHLLVVEHLIAEMADVNYETKEGATPLCVACLEGHLPVVERLIAEKANVKYETKEGVTPLHAACLEGHLLVVECLIAEKADVNHQTKDGATPLHAACHEGHLPVVERLIAAMADVNHQTKLGETALHFAVDQEHEDIVNQLLEANADPDLPEMDSQETALMMAAKKGNVGIVRKLIKHGACVNLTNKDGNTAYDLASVEGHTGVCQELLSKQSS